MTKWVFIELACLYCEMEKFGILGNFLPIYLNNRCCCSIQKKHLNYLYVNNWFFILPESL